MAQLTHESEIAPLVDGKQVLMVMHIGPQLQPPNCSAGRPAPLQVIVDGRNSNTAMLAINYVSIIVDRFNTDWAAARHGGSRPPAHIWRRGPGSIPTWKAAGSSCPASSAC